MTPTILYSPSKDGKMITTETIQGRGDKGE
jgi:hypothetical protein